MIHSLHISNFRSYKDLSLEFHPGVNVIIGNTDSGKSNILRAVRLVTNNKPFGNDMLSWWGGELKIVLATSDGFIVSREKGKENLYTLGDTVFKAFGKDVPEEILKVLNMNDINLQQQLDSPFLISATPGEVAAHFNNIAHLSEIDSSTAQINSWILSLNNTIKSDTVRIAQEKEKVSQYDYLEKLEIDLEVLEQQEKTMLAEIKNRNALNTAIEDLEKVEADIVKASGLLIFETQVDALLVLIDKRKKKRTEHEELIDLIEDIEDLDKQITEQDNMVSLEPAVKALLSQHEKLKKAEQERKDLVNHIASMTEVETKLAAEQIALEKREEKFDEELGDKCPLCETEL